MLSVKPHPARYGNELPKSIIRTFPMPWRVVCLGLCIVVTLVDQCSGWSELGHQAVAMVTASALKPKVSSVMKRLMGPQDVVDVANWAHDVEKEYPETTAFHFLLSTGSKSQCGGSIDINEENCPQGHCIVRALQFFYNKLKGNSASSPVMVSTIQFTEADALKFLVNLIGDLHQPLHLGFKSDNGGQNIPVSFHITARSKNQTSLYQYWDADFIRKLATQRPDFWYGGWTHVNSLRSDKMKALEAEWNDTPEDSRSLLFEKWANESYSKACSTVYQNSFDKSFIAPNDEIRPAYENELLPIFKQQILVAGARTAIILNSVLADRDLVKLRQSSGLVLKGILLTVAC